VKGNDSFKALGFGRYSRMRHGSVDGWHWVDMQTRLGMRSGRLSSGLPSEADLWQYKRLFFGIILRLREINPLILKTGATQKASFGPSYRKGFPS
jgi:hypothetical protein